MVAWVVLPLPASQSYLYDFCRCMTRKEGGDTWRRSRWLGWLVRKNNIYKIYF